MNCFYSEGIAKKVHGRNGSENILVLGYEIYRRMSANLAEIVIVQHKKLAYEKSGIASSLNAA